MNLHSEAMTTVPAVQPTWAQAAFVNALWVATSETPEWIAARTDALLSALSPVFGISSWSTYKGDRWEGSPETLTDIVRRFIVRDRPTVDDPDGEAIPENGYSFIVSGVGHGVELSVRVAAGCIALGRRVPMHTLAVKFRQTTTGAVTSEMGDAICVAVAEAWKPASFELADTLINRTARRGGWKIGVGYRTWISAQVAAVTQVAEGLTMSKLAGGTLISAPDDWPADRVVEAMTATLRENGLDEIPH
ncbi:Uncharacterised protein [Mycobacteroides abscessus subsp. massiliense]|uniref:Bacteriophage protein n=2 Tax=Mycobacteroides abscessus TaxID=36809 RepID=A0AB33A4X9_9MYCO|nr:hypothetical protein MASS_0211 [Mycobacteroides abscessus subsp. bolletii 50594]BBZ83324.1 hypothetical protein MABM_32400 [Mycobacteroides abscessus]SLI76726.1 Uncharacterised protein [Mycobacteroides abscessus subsp. massiliense]